MDVPIHFPKAIEFQALIEKLKNRNLVAAQYFEERIVAQTNFLVDQVKIMAKKTKVMANHA